MDEKIEKALATANFIATLSNQKRILLEEYNQKLVYYADGATFKITPGYIAFIKAMVDMGNTTDVGLVDSNNLPVMISDLEEMLQNLIEVYNEVTTEYVSKYNEIKSKRKIADIVNL